MSLGDASRQALLDGLRQEREQLPAPCTAIPRLVWTEMTAEDRQTGTAKVVVVMPAYNAAKTLEATYRGIPLDLVDEIILVDDVSQDDTVEIAERLGLKVIIHAQNRGYGGNQKTCYLAAIRDGADIIVMLHPDNQYDSTLIPELIQPIAEGRADLVLGSRILSGTALSGGMPWWKYVSNRGLSFLQNRTFGLALSEYHTGFRAYSRRLLETIPFLLNSEDFVFDAEVIAQAVAFGFRLAEIPVPTRYFPEASSVGFRRSVVYGLKTLLTLAKFKLDRAGLVAIPQFRRPLSEVAPAYLDAERSSHRA